MAQAHPMSRLGCWEGYEVGAQWLERRGGRSWCVIRLEPLRGYRRCCSRCGQFTAAIHDLEERRVRDLPLFEHWVELRVLRVRVECPTCGPKLERLAWLAAYARVTRRLAESAAQLCKVMTLRHVVRYFGLDWKTVKQIDRAGLLRELGPLDLDGLEVIELDEFAIHKGHRYATVIVEPTRKRVLWIGRGRGRKDVRPFFRLLGPARCAQLCAAAMDMNASYELEVRRRDQARRVARSQPGVVRRLSAARCAAGAMASATTPTSSSRYGPPSPELGDEPKKKARVLRRGP